MKILALEMSSATASLAVASEGEFIEVHSFEAPRGRGAEIFTLLDEMRPAWTGLGRMAIGLGPGSYNGLRTACALAGSFQMSLGIELVTAPSCCLLDVEDRCYAAIGDARGGRIWKATVADRHLTADISLHDFAAAEEIVRQAMDDLNVELEFQVRRNLREWLEPAGSAAVPSRPGAIEREDLPRR